MERDGRGRAVWLAALVGYAIFLAIVLLWPTSGTQSAGAAWLVDIARAFGVAPEIATQARAEFVANVLIVVPLSALAALVWPRSTWRDVTAWAFVLACAIETVQGLLLPGRTPSTVDVVANTLGGLVGALAIAALRHRGGR